MKFNYSQLRFFNSKGTELPLVYDAPKITLFNPTYENEKGEYAIIRTSPNNISTLDEFIDNVDLKRINIGKRFKESDRIKSSIILDNHEHTDINVYPGALSYIEYYSNIGNEKYIDIDYSNLSKASKQSFWKRYFNKGLEISKIPFPSYKFISKLQFDKVSTGLVETESIFVLVDNPEIKTSSNTSKFTTVYDLAQQVGYDDVKEFIQRYKLMFFIDNREQKNFRFFTVSGDEVIWSDRYIIDFNNDNTVAIGDNGSGFRVDIGFVGEEDGLYEESMHIILIDTLTKDISTNYPGDAYFIGKIEMSIETEGEDERYRTFFTNIGLPDPKQTNDVFADTDINEDLPNYISINDHSKKLYLSYNEIFPYIGTYKALINSLKVLGYDDVFFKEWYKEIDSVPNKGYVSYNISYNNSRENTIKNVPIEERIHLKKLNWLSMMYKLNEIVDTPIDKFGFPTVVEKSNYYNSGTIIKLISLKKYLEKYILGINCHILDICGEGIIFERYNTLSYGSYQNVLEYTNEKGISLEINEPVSTLDIDTNTAEINAIINTNNTYTKISDLTSIKFIDYCDGYFDDVSIFNNNIENITDNKDYIYFGKTLELNNNFNNFEIKYIGEIDTFRFNKNYITDESPDILLDNNELIFDPTEISHTCYNAAFKHNRLPIIQTSNCIIKCYSDEPNGIIDEIYTISLDTTHDNSKSYKITDKNNNVFYLQDTFTLLPPIYTKDFICPNIGESFIYKTIDGISHERKYNICNDLDITNINHIDTKNQNFGLRYTIDNIHGTPCFKIIGYTSLEQNILDASKEYYIEIIEGKMMFNNDNNITALAFSYDEDKKSVNNNILIYESLQLPTSYTYIDNNNQLKHFTNNMQYGDFVESYKNFIYEDCIKYNNTYKIPFVYAGNYKINAILCDEYNNIFTSNKKDVTILSNSIKNISIYTQTNDDNVIDISNIVTEQPIFKYSQQYNMVSSKIRSYHKLKDVDIDDNITYEIERNFDDNSQNGTLKFNKPIIGEYAIISNTSDKFVLCGTIDTPSCTAIILQKRSSNDGHMYITNGRILSNVMDCYGLTYDSYNDINNIESILTIENNDIIGTLADVNLSIYDTISESLIEQLPGILIPSIKKYIYYFIPTVHETSDVINKINNHSLHITPAWTIESEHKYLGKSELRCKINNKLVNFPFGEKLKYNTLLKLSYKLNGNEYYGHNLMLMGYKNYNIDDFNRILSSETLFPRLNIAKHNCEDINIYISPVDQDTVFYKDITIKNTSNNIQLKNNRDTKNTSQHIDAGYSISIRNFDIMNAHNAIKDVSEIETKKYKEILISYNDKFDKITTNNPFLLSVKNDNTNNNDTILFKLYRRLSTSKSLYIESYTKQNKYLLLDIPDKGDYDLEIISFDNLGNSHKRYISNAIKII